MQGMFVKIVVDTWNVMSGLVEADTIQAFKRIVDGHMDRQGMEG